MGQIKNANIMQKLFAIFNGLMILLDKLGESGGCYAPR